MCKLNGCECNEVIPAPRLSISLNAGDRLELEWYRQNAPVSPNGFANPRPRPADVPEPQVVHTFNFDVTVESRGFVTVLAHNLGDAVRECNRRLAKGEIKMGDTSIIGGNVDYLTAYDGRAIDTAVAIPEVNKFNSPADLLAGVCLRCGERNCGCGE